MPSVTLRNNQGDILLQGFVEDNDFPEDIVAKQLYGEASLVYYLGSENDTPLRFSVYYEDKQCRCTKVLASNLILYVE